MATTLGQMASGNWNGITPLTNGRAGSGGYGTGYAGYGSYGGAMPGTLDASGQSPYGGGVDANNNQIFMPRATDVTTAAQGMYPTQIGQSLNGWTATNAGMLQLPPGWTVGPDGRPQAPGIGASQSPGGAGASGTGAGSALPATNSGAGLATNPGYLSAANDPTTNQPVNLGSPSGGGSAGLSTTGGQNFGQFDPNATPSGGYLSGSQTGDFLGGSATNPASGGQVGSTNQGFNEQTGTSSNPNSASASPNSVSNYAPLGSGAGLNFNEAPGNYTGGMTLGNYLNPAYEFARDEGLRKLQSSYAGAGDFLSGNALRGASDYLSGTALNQAFQPAMNNYMADKNFNYGVDSGDRTFAANQANLDRNYNYNVDTGNRAFDYAAQTGDRSFNSTTLNQLLNAGLQGTQGQANSNNTLALLMAQLAQSGGAAAGTGTIGQNNAITGAISQILSNLNQNSILNRILPQSGG